MIALCGVIGILIFLPVSEGTRQQLFNLLGIALTATIETTLRVGSQESG